MTAALGETPVPAGPLAVRWLRHDVPTIRAGVVSLATVELENAGSVPWDSGDGTGICLGYHWLDPLGNPIVWDGLLSAFPTVVAPGERISAAMTIAGPIPPGRYRLALDVVDGGRCWFAEVGNRRPELEVAVEPRLGARSLGVRIVEGNSEELEQLTRQALDAQEEPVGPDGEAIAFLAPGCMPEPDWSRRVLDAHEEGYAAVGGSLVVSGGRLARRRMKELAPWSEATGRRPGWSSPLVCPSIVCELVPRVRWLEPIAGLPSIAPPTAYEPFVYDGRISIRVTPRALRRAGRPPA